MDLNIKSDRIQDSIALLLLFAAAAILFNTSHVDGNFHWSDASRHALNGVFLLDFFAEMPIPPDQWKNFAIQYYLQYPALTIGFYPPLLALTQTPFYYFFGVSHYSAQLSVVFFFLLAAWGTYAISRRFLPPVQALAVGLIFMGSPEIALWGRQVMLEIPAYAGLLWSVFFFILFLQKATPGRLYAAILCYLAALYFKQTVIFILPVFLVFLWQRFQRQEIAGRPLLIAIFLFAVGMVPLTLLTIFFGSVNVGAVAGGQSIGEMSRFSEWSRWFYIEAIPDQIGWPITVLGSVFIIALIVYRPWRSRQLPVWFFIGWFASGYLFFTMIVLKDARHSVFIVFPLILFAVLFVDRLIASKKTAAALTLLLAVYSFHDGVIAHDAPYIDGYRQAVEVITDQAPANGVVLFSGSRDGSFIFNMRANKKRQDLAILRADKILLDVAVKRIMGISERNLNEAQIIDLLNRYNVSILVVEPVFWNDVKQMQVFVKTLKNRQFKKITRIAIKANRDISEKHLDIYRYVKTGDGSDRGPIEMKLGFSNMKIKGEVSSSTFGSK
jgi:hypothetical protein